MPHISARVAFKVPKYGLFKFDVDNLTAVYSTDTIVGSIVQGGKAKVWYQKKLLDGEILALSDSEDYLNNWEKQNETEQVINQTPEGEEGEKEEEEEAFPMVSTMKSKKRMLTLDEDGTPSNFKKLFKNIKKTSNACQLSLASSSSSCNLSPALNSCSLLASSASQSSPASSVSQSSPASSYQLYMSSRNEKMQLANKQHSKTEMLEKKLEQMERRFVQKVESLEGKMDVLLNLVTKLTSTATAAASATLTAVHTPTTAPLSNSSFHSLLFSPDDIMPPSSQSMPSPSLSQSVSLPFSQFLRSSESLPSSESFPSPLHLLQNMPPSSLPSPSQPPFSSYQPFISVPGSSTSDLSSMVDLAFRLCLQIFLPEILKIKGYSKKDI